MGKRLLVMGSITVAIGAAIIGFYQFVTPSTQIARVDANKSFKSHDRRFSSRFKSSSNKLRHYRRNKSSTRKRNYKPTVIAKLPKIAPQPATQSSTQLSATASREPTLEERLEAKLRPAEIAFNAPSRLWLNETKTVELVIAPATSPTGAASVLSSGLSGDIVVDNTTYSMFMEARLSGDGFKVSDHVQRKTLLASKPAKWIWKVTPTEAGIGKQLTLEVNAILMADNRELPPLPVRTFHREILVDVTLWQNLVSKVGAMETVNSAIVGLGGIGGALIGFFAWLRRRKEP